MANPSFVRTVTGDVRPESVGFTHCHEHTFLRPGPSSRLNADLLLDDPDRTAAELAQYALCGGRTVVDAQPIGPERAPLWQKAVSERTGVQIVAATGFHRTIYYDPDHFRFHESAEKLAERMIAEITEGMLDYDESGAARPTGVPAGLLKFASDYHVITPQARKAAEAAAIAHRATGAPILTHTERGTCGLEQIELFGKLGVAPGSLLLSHLDRNPDPYVHHDVADAGAYLIYDAIARTKYFPDSTIVMLIRAMTENGHAPRLLLGMDMAARSMWRSYGGGPGMTYLAQVFLIKLRRAGLGHEQIHMFTEYNPSKALAFRSGGVRG